VDSWAFFKYHVNKIPTAVDVEYAMHSILANIEYFVFVRDVCCPMWGVKLPPRRQWSVCRDLWDLATKYIALFEILRAPRTPFRRRFQTLIELLRLQMIFAGCAYPHAGVQDPREVKVRDGNES
jgi:hypothetical protein